MIQQAPEKFAAAPPMAKPVDDDIMTRRSKPGDGPQLRQPTLPDGVYYIHRQLPSDLQLLSWAERQIGTPRIIRRFILWSFRRLAHWYTQARTLMIVLRSPEVADDAFRKRQEICHACSENDKGYCRACNCPKWILAQLEYKNRRAKWLCPRAKHPGEYPKYGCPGCGKNHAAKPQSALARGV